MLGTQRMGVVGQMPVVDVDRELAAQCGDQRVVRMRGSESNCGTQHWAVSTAMTHTRATAAPADRIHTVRRFVTPPTVYPLRVWCKV